MKRFIRSIVGLDEHRVLGFMLLSLHLSIWGELGSALSSSLMLTHIGLFLLWQPIWRQDVRLDHRTAVIFVLLTLGYVYFLGWWLILCWMILLIGIVAGRSLSRQSERYAYLLTLVFLICELLIKCIPELFVIGDLPDAVILLFKYGLVAVPLAILFIPSAGQPGSVDFFRATSVALLVAMLALGSLLNMYHTGVDYPVALLQSLMVLSAFLFAISWLLSPHRGFTGLAQLWERSLLNIGTPFEQWLTGLAHLADRQQTPREFLEAAANELIKLPWIVAVSWQSPDSTGAIGEPTENEIVASLEELTLKIYTRRRIGPTLLIHSNLLLQLLQHFYIAKAREQELAQQAHLHAIYETGARVTHDIKNLLQSLHTITLALEQDRSMHGVPIERRKRGRSGQQLFERQLPHLTQRLQLALDKLQAPQGGAPEKLPATQWWNALLARNDASDISFESTIVTNPPIPTELFDSVAENLLENAWNKRAVDPEVKISVSFSTTDTAIRLRVTDTGPAIPARTATQLFHHRVESDYGLGIGLYQAHRQAELLGYTLHLAANKPGEVCFELLKEAAENETQPQFSLFAANTSG